MSFALLALACGTAAAQGGRCKSRVMVDSVFTAPAVKGYDYYLQLRNATGTALRADITFNGFAGKRVTLTQVQWKAVATPSRASQKIKFGKGFDSMIATDTVRILYDLPATTDVPSISVTNCR